MVAHMNEESLRATLETRRGGVLEPLARRSGTRASRAGTCRRVKSSAHRLRRRRGAAAVEQRGSAPRATPASALLLPQLEDGRLGRRRRAGLRSRRRSTAMRRRASALLRLGLPEGQPAGDDAAKLFAQAGYQAAHPGALLLPGHRRPRDRVHPDPRAGDGALRRAGRARRRHHRARLGARDARQVKELADLRAPWPNYGPVRWVLAVKEDSPHPEGRRISQGKRIATEAVDSPGAT